MGWITSIDALLAHYGTAKLTADATLRARFAKDGREPRTAIVIKIAEIYSQCARDLQRSALWTAGINRQICPPSANCCKTQATGPSTAQSMTPNAPPARIWACGNLAARPFDK